MLAESGLRIEWQLHRRSRAHSNLTPRSTLIGPLHTSVLLIIKCMAKQVRDILGDNRECVVGYVGMFKDNTNIICEGSLPQIMNLQPIMSECVFISPTKAIFRPGASAEDFTAAITAEEWLRTVGLKYRRQTFCGSRS